MTSPSHVIAQIEERILGFGPATFDRIGAIEPGGRLRNGVLLKGHEALLQLSAHDTFPAADKNRPAGFALAFKPKP
jgi:hypothetical protein